MSNSTCSRCGTKNVEGSRFCAGCGADLTVAAPPRPAPPPPPPRPMAPPEFPRSPDSRFGPAPGPAPVAPTSTYSGQAIAALVLGMVGFMFCGPFTAIPGIIVGRKELNAIREGSSAPSNESMAKAGYYISIGVTVLYVLIIFFAVFAGILPAILAGIRG